MTMTSACIKSIAIFCNVSIYMFFPQTSFFPVTTTICNNHQRLIQFFFGQGLGECRLKQSQMPSFFITPSLSLSVYIHNLKSHITISFGVKTKPDENACVYYVSNSTSYFYQKRQLFLNILFTFTVETLTDKVFRNS